MTCITTILMAQLYNRFYQIEPIYAKLNMWMEGEPRWYGDLLDNQFVLPRGGIEFDSFALRPYLYLTKSNLCSNIVSRLSSGRKELQTKGLQEIGAFLMVIFFISIMTMDLPWYFHLKFQSANGNRWNGRWNPCGQFVAHD